MPDTDPTDDWPVFNWLWQLSDQLVGRVQANFATATLPHVLPQLAVLLLALLAARLFSRRLAARTRRFIATRTAEQQPLMARLEPVVFPLLWMALLWFGVVALHEAGAPAKLLEIVLGLLAAWAGVRLATSFVASVFWSRVIAVGIVAVIALKAFGLWQATLGILDQMALTLGNVRLSVLGVLEATLILACSWWAATLVAGRVDHWAEHLPQVSPSARVLLSKLFRFGLGTLAVVIAMHAIGIDLTTLAVFSGAVGLGIGFGLQKIFSNLICGVILLLDRSVKPGDVIAVDEHYGWINALGSRYVSVVTRDGIEHLIPNEDLIGGRVENWSHSNNLLRLHAPIGIAYTADLDRALALAEQAAGEVARVLHEPPPRCLILDFGESTVDLDLRFWISDPRNGVHNVRSEVLRRIWHLYHDAGIEFPFPQRDLHLRSTAPIPVQMVRPNDRTEG